MPTSTSGSPEAAAASSTSQMGNRLSEKRGSNQSSLSSTGNQSQDGDCLSLLSSNAADYDHIRNTTLMFFLDRLFIASKDGKEARTLHDLSCLFGTKDFTKEMRQIVGASRNGLKKFLQSYPSLFTIEGDKVYLTQLRQDAAAPTRDYNKEAVEYFTQKLQQFGPSLVPIKNLFGYRSQASQEVRHVSGKNTREFKQFLKNHEHVFEMLADEHVILKSALKELEARGESRATIQRISSIQGSDSVDQIGEGDDRNEHEASVMDPYLNKQFAGQIEQSLAKILDAKLEGEERRVTLEYLHETILTECQNPLFLKMVKTIDDFKVFLRMHPKIFKRFKSTSGDGNDQSDYVTLLTEEERKELELQAYPSSSAAAAHHHPSLQHSTLERSNTLVSSGPIGTSSQQVGDSSGPASLPPLHQMSGQQTATATSGRQTPQQKPNLISQKTNNNGDSTRSSKQQQQQSPSSALRANAPPFVPSPRSALQATMSNQMGGRQGGASNNRLQLQRSHSSLTNQQHQRNSIVDPRQALRNHLMRASVENQAASGIYSASKQSNGAQYHNSPGMNSNVNISKPLSNSNNNNNNNLMSNQNQQVGGNSDDLRARTVNIVREASNIITRIMTTADAVAFDCKGYNLGFNGQITLIQFGFLPKQQKQQNSSLMSTTTTTATVDENKQPEGDKLQKPEVCIFDLITNPELAYCLKPLLESEQIVKIVHDVRNKSNALHVQFGIMLNHVFDTQVANLVIQQQETGKPAYKSRYISMSKLCEVYGDESLMKYRNIIKSKTRHSGASSSGQSKMKDVNYWRTRPLTDAMIYESTLDVYCLVGGIYQNLKSRIKPEYQPLFEQLNLEGVLARIKPDEIRSVKKERKIDLEVIELKRKLYSESTGSIVLSNREIRLLRHIDLTDEVRDKIQHCKKVAKKLERLDMKAALVAQQSLQSGASIHSSDSSDGVADASLDPNASMNSNGSTGGLSASEATMSLPGGTTTDAAMMTSSEQCVAQLMDGSMFDEFKDKMIESSSLLESLEDDDDEDDVAMQSIQHHGGDLSSLQLHTHHSHHQSHNYLDHPSVGSGSDCCCSCQCHRNSIATNTTDGEKEKTSLSAKSAHSHQSMEHQADANGINKDENQENKNSDDEDRDSTGSKAVDMAVQCDLLS